MSDLSVHFDDVHFQYFESPYGVQDINLQISPGQRILLVGHNGSGKSTILSLIGGRRKRGRGVTTVLGSDAFEDTSLNAKVALIGNPWPPEAYFANTVSTVASPAPDEERKKYIADALHLPLGAPVDKMSSGEKRRVQILHGMLRKASVYLLDECSTDIDVAERATVLALVKKECLENGACCVYATHILDGVKDWATHVALIADGKIVSYSRVEDIHMTLDTFAHRFMAKKQCEPFESYILKAQEQQQQQQSPVVSQVAEVVATRLTDGTHASRIRPLESGVLSAALGKSYFADVNAASRPVVVSCVNLTYKAIFSELNFSIYQGSRTLLLGCNGSGKSTMLNMLGGKQYFDNSKGSLKVLGKACYDDMTLNGLVSFCGDWWVRTPGGEVRVYEMLPTRKDLTARGSLLVQLLDIDLEWDVRFISAGEQKRVQLLFHMYADKPVILLDEATADLDVDQRHELLKFLYLESALRGVTVVYTTHIFEGLHGWATDALVFDRTKRGVHATLTGSVDLEEVTQMLVTLKAGETF